MFKNHGASAWASMSHSHSQILSLSIVLPGVSVHLESMKEYFNQTGKCSLCEVHSKDLLINETNHFTSIAPFAASFPFEIWIIRRDHSSHFYELDNEKVTNASWLYSYMVSPMSFLVLHYIISFTNQKFKMEIKPQEKKKLNIKWLLDTV